MSESNNVGRFVWYDLMSPDPEGSKRFYTAVLGWGTRVDRPLMGVEGRQPYTMWTAGETPIAGLVPLSEAYWLGYIGVADVGRSVAHAKELGGKVLFGPDAIPNVGRFAVIEDPQHAVIAVFQGVEISPPQPFAPKQMEFCWHELATIDSRAALDFYTAMFGWEVIDGKDAEPRNAYLVFGYGGVPYGAIFHKPPQLPAAAWCYCIRVADVRKAANRVAQNGGQIIDGPAEGRSGDWNAQCTDPSGATFAVR